MSVGIIRNLGSAGGGKLYSWHKYRRKLYLYKNGDEKGETTGGWAVLPNDAYASTDYSLAKNSTNMTLTRTQAQRFRALGTINLIDTNRYTSIHLDYTNLVRTDSNATAGISLKNTYVGVTGDWGSVVQSLDSASSNSNLACDISAYNGNYDIAIGINGGRGAVTVNNVWLEGNIYLGDVFSANPKEFPVDGFDESGEFYYKMIVEIPMPNPLQVYKNVGEFPLTGKGYIVNDTNISLNVGAGIFHNFVAFDKLINLANYTNMRVRFSWNGTSYTKDLDITNYNDKLYLSFVYRTDASGTAGYIGISNSLSFAETINIYPYTASGCSSMVLYEIVLS